MGRQPVASFQLPADKEAGPPQKLKAGGWQLAAGRWQLAAGSWPQVAVFVYTQRLVPQFFVTDQCRSLPAVRSILVYLVRSVCA
jgi:hypothetical protein